MKCSKCGGEIKNLPDYIEDVHAELLCSVCAGTADRSDDTALTLDKVRYRAVYSDSEAELEIAA